MGAASVESFPEPGRSEFSRVDAVSNLRFSSMGAASALGGAHKFRLIFYLISLYYNERSSEQLQKAGPAEERARSERSEKNGNVRSE